MDIRDISNVFVAKNCARTATLATEVIDGQTVAIGSVQPHVKLVDSGAAALSYYGPGELLITDAVGLSLDNTVTKAVPQISFNQRSYDGMHSYAQVAVKGSKVISYTFTPYAVKAEQTTVIKTIDATLQDHTYMLKIRRIGTDNNTEKRPSVKTFSFKSASAGSTADQIITGLVDAINTGLNNDEYMPVQATADLTNDAIILQALPLPWELDKYKYCRLKFVVELVNFDATITNNMYADLTEFTVTYPKATIGAGSYQQVAEMESQAKLNTGANRDKVARTFVRRPEVVLDAQPFEDDGTTVNRYDTVVVNWENIDGAFQAGIKQQGSVICFLPLDDNATNQQADIIATLNKYIVTEFGVGSAITLSTP